MGDGNTPGSLPHTLQSGVEGDRELLAAVIDSSDDAIVTKTMQGIITSWNRGAQRIFGYSAQETLGQLVTLLFPPERIGEEAQLLARIANGERVEHFETVRVRKDGTRIDVSVTLSPIRNNQGVIVGASKIARDITEQKHSQGKIREQLARLDLLQQVTRAISESQDLTSIFQIALQRLELDVPVDFACVLLLGARLRHFTVTSVGKASEGLSRQMALSIGTVLRVDNNDLSACIAGQLIYEPDIEGSQSPFPSQFARAGLKSLVLAPLQASSGVFGIIVAARRQAQAFSSNACEFLRQLGEHVGLAARQAELHQSLQRAYDDLRHSQQIMLQQERLKVLGQMASGITHDINNAISPIALYTELLLERERNLSESARQYLTLIQRGVDEVAQTVGRLREFYRTREPDSELEPVDVLESIQRVIELTRARWSDIPQRRGVNIQLQCEVPDELPRIPGFESEIRDALVNLVFNAVDAMPAGGTLTLRAREMTADSNPSSAVSRVLIEVCDTGTGMDEDTRRRCLEPFFTTKGQQGTGMGLAMVFGMARRHGADLDIESQPGVGTVVRLTFDVAIENPSPAIAPQPALRVQPQRLLIIDDNPVLRRSVCEVLESDGHQVVTADDGQKGIDTFLKAQADGQPFSLVITDLGMPSADGSKVAAAVKEAAPSTPVILLTGWGQRLIADGEVPPHVDRVLSKPPKVPQLRSVIAELTRGGHSLIDPG